MIKAAGIKPPPKIIFENFKAWRHKFNNMKTLKPFIRLTGLLALAWVAAACSFGAPIGFQSVPRDAFPVFDNPDMLTVSEAEELKMVHDMDPVIGIAVGGEARAYPIDIMGVHELGNDVIAGVPIAVTW